MTHTSIRGWRGTFAMLALAAGGALVASCGGDGTTSGATDSTVAPTAAATDAPSTPTTRAARMLPVTPVSFAYEVADPYLEALPGAQVFFGTYEGGGYQIETPADWNGSVVYFAHGFRGNPPQLTVGPPPLRDYLIARGFAWAASSYTKNGYEPGAAARDTLALQAVVAEKLGVPQRQYLYGQSMGGHVTTLSLEQYPDAYDGALTECGVVSGHDILDYFLSWGVLSGYFSGTDLYEEVRSGANSLGTKIDGVILPALGSPDEPTAAGRRFISTIEQMTGGPRPYFLEGLKENFGFNFAILVNAVGTAGPANAASQNIDTTYAIGEGLGITSSELNSDVPRVQANSVYRDPATYPEFAPMSGEIRVPLLTLHGTGDLFVPISLEQRYGDLVAAAGQSDLLVQRAIRRPGHCNFSDAERERAFEDLVGWVEGAPKPAGDTLDGDLSETGRAFTTPALADDPGTITGR